MSRITCAKAQRERSNDKEIEPMAMEAANLRYFCGLTALRPAATTGIEGISHRFWTIQDIRGLSPHRIYLIKIGSFVVTINRDDKRQSNRRFSRRDAD